MRKKNLLFYTILTSIALCAYDSAATDMIRPEDEEILWDVEATEGETAKGIMYDLTDGSYDKEGKLVIHHQQRVPSKGEAIQSIPVPDEINQQAPLYDTDEVIKINPNTPRSLNYPIGKERESINAPRLEAFDPDFFKKDKKSPEEEAARQAMLKSWKDAINDCQDRYKDKLGLEVTFLNAGDLYDNAASLSQTMTEIEQCYDSLGMDILDNFYPQDREKLKEYNQTVADFHIKSNDASFNPKYCGETCSLSAVVHLQLDKFDEFKAYLFKLIKEAPEKPVIPTEPTEINEEAPWVDENIFDDDMIREDEPQAPRYIENKPVPQAVRFRDQDGNLHIIRQKQSELKEVSPVSTPEVIHYDTDGIPLIDERDLL